jgi:hypothetical protein
MERKPIPEAEIKLAQELCVQMGECAATYYIVLLLKERERLMRYVERLLRELRPFGFTDESLRLLGHTQHEPHEWGANCPQAPDLGPHECNGKSCTDKHVCLRCGAFCLCRWCNAGNPRIPSSVSDALVHTDTPVGRVKCIDPPSSAN